MAFWFMTKKKYTYLMNRQAFDVWSDHSYLSALQLNALQPFKYLPNIKGYILIAYTLFGIFKTV
jgi:hypothetical protein